MHISAERHADERQAEDRKPDTTPKPDAFRNDPEDPANPNEVREQHLKKVGKLKES
jgi:hypothetical protein